MTDEGRIEAKALIVDDDPAVRRTCAELLRTFVSVVETAPNGETALLSMKRSHFDVILTDIAMPGMDGLTFLRAVREQDLDIPVILITGYPVLESAVTAMEYGAFRYLTKPVAFETLRSTVRRALSLHRIARLKRAALEELGADGKRLGDRAGLEARFDKALDRLWMAFQPIVSWPEHTLFGYEALVRSAEPTLLQPADLFDAAARLGRIHDLGRAIRARVAAAAVHAPDGVTLFVNLHAEELTDNELFSPSAALASIARRVILEITERTALEKVTGIGVRVDNLRKLGFRVALDDLGAGYAGLSSFTQLDPDLVKLDISLVRGIDQSLRKQGIVRAMVQLCREELEVAVVGEGVETAGERDALAGLGCNLQQGFLFAHPERDFPAPRW